MKGSITLILFISAIAICVRHGHEDGSNSIAKIDVDRDYHSMSACVFELIIHSIVPIKKRSTSYTSVVIKRGWMTPILNVIAVPLKAKARYSFALRHK